MENVESKIYLTITGKGKKNKPAKIDAGQTKLEL